MTALDREVSILHLLVVFVGHLGQVRVDVIEALLVLVKNQIVVVLVHLRDLPLLLNHQLLLREALVLLVVGRARDEGGKGVARD